VAGYKEKSKIVRTIKPFEKSTMTLGAPDGHISPALYKAYVMVKLEEAYTTSNRNTNLSSTIHSIVLSVVRTCFSP